MHGKMWTCFIIVITVDSSRDLQNEAALDVCDQECVPVALWENMNISLHIYMHTYKYK
jgi:hypothetical protein